MVGLFKAVILNRDSQESLGMRSCTPARAQKPPSKQFAPAEYLATLVTECVEGTLVPECLEFLDDRDLRFLQPFSAHK